MRIRIVDTAKDDLRAGHAFYELQREDLGEYFLDSLASDIDSLLLYAGIHARVHGYFRMLSRRFPYAIYYTEAQNEVTVWRVLDLRMDPRRIRRALRSNPR